MKTYKNAIKIATPADRIQEALTLSGLKEERLSELTKISPVVLKSYLSGENMPEEDDLYKMSFFLAVNPFWLNAFDVPEVFLMPHKRINQKKLKKIENLPKEKQLKPLSKLLRKLDIEDLTWLLKALELVVENDEGSVVNG